MISGLTGSRIINRILRLILVEEAMATINEIWGLRDPLYEVGKALPPNWGILHIDGRPELRKVYPSHKEYFIFDV